MSDRSCLAWVLLGAALAGGEHRKVIFDRLHPDSVPEGVWGLLEAIRHNRVKQVRSWLGEMGIANPAKEHVLDSILNSMERDRKRAVIRRAVVELELSVKVEDLSELKARIADLMSELEDV